MAATSDVESSVYLETGVAILNVSCVDDDLILVQHQYNNYTTISHMRVGPI
jgi:hypothetical protein